MQGIITQPTQPACQQIEQKIYKVTLSYLSIWSLHMFNDAHYALEDEAA